MDGETYSNFKAGKEFRSYPVKCPTFSDEKLTPEEVEWLAKVVRINLDRTKIIILSSDSPSSFLHARLREALL